MFNVCICYAFCIYMCSFIMSIRISTVSVCTIVVCSFKINLFSDCIMFIVVPLRLPTFENLVSISSKQFTFVGSLEFFIFRFFVTFAVTKMTDNVICTVSCRMRRAFTSCTLAIGFLFGAFKEGMTCFSTYSTF